jgi:hypothetical protein
MGSEILRCAQDDRAVLPAALLPTRAHARLRLMGIEADKSGLEMHYYLSPRQGPTFGYALLVANAKRRWVR